MKAGDGAQQGGLTGPIFTEYSHSLTWRKDEVHFVKCSYGSVEGGHPAQDKRPLSARGRRFHFLTTYRL
ncbi:MAG: hypothetical protein ABSH29_25945, partial [Acidimicrobiales bacterium]